MHRYSVPRDFLAPDLNGLFRRTTREKLMFPRWVGEEYEQSAIFAVLAGAAFAPQGDKSKDVTA
jgi:hypothetical protein